MLFLNSALVMFTVALFMTTLRSSADGRGVLGVCIQNCGQCKKMYGDFFLGQQCAEECLHTFGFSTPDCNKAASIQRFLGVYRRRYNGPNLVGRLYGRRFEAPRRTTVRPSDAFKRDHVD